MLGNPVVSGTPLSRPAALRARSGQGAKQGATLPALCHHRSPSWVPPQFHLLFDHPQLSYPDLRQGDLASVRCESGPSSGQPFLAVTTKLCLRTHPKPSLGVSRSFHHRPRPTRRAPVKMHPTLVSSYYVPPAAVLQIEPSLRLPFRFQPREIPKPVTYPVRSIQTPRLTSYGARQRLGLLSISHSAQHHFLGAVTGLSYATRACFQTSQRFRSLSAPCAISDTSAAYQCSTRPPLTEKAVVGTNGFRLPISHANRVTWHFRANPFMCPFPCRPIYGSRLTT